MNQKIKLKRTFSPVSQLKRPPVHWQSALPFVENTRGLLIHRPMEVTTFTHWYEPWIAIKYYCGNTVCGKKNLTFLSQPPNDAVVCESCETKAVLSGLPSSSEIAGRHVHIGKLKVFKTCGCSDA